MSAMTNLPQPGWRRHLAPSGGPWATVGWTPELHGPDGRLVDGFDPTVGELRMLARYWASQMAQAEAAMADGSYDPVLARMERFGEERLREIATLVGVDVAQEALAMVRAIHGQWEPMKPA